MFFSGNAISFCSRSTCKTSEKGRIIVSWEILRQSPSFCIRMSSSPESTFFLLSFEHFLLHGHFLWAFAIIILHQACACSFTKCLFAFPLFMLGNGKQLQYPYQVFVLFLLSSLHSGIIAYASVNPYLFSRVLQQHLQVELRLKKSNERSQNKCSYESKIRKLSHTLKIQKKPSYSNFYWFLKENIFMHMKEN